MTKLKYWNVEPEEPSLSSDTRSMLNDEVWAAINAENQHRVDLGNEVSRLTERVLALEQKHELSDLGHPLPSKLPWEDSD